MTGMQMADCRLQISRPQSTINLQSAICHLQFQEAL